MHLCENKSKECNNFAILDVSLIFYDKNISFYQTISDWVIEIWNIYVCIYIIFIIQK